MDEFVLPVAGLEVIDIERGAVGEPDTDDLVVMLVRNDTDVVGAEPWR